MNQIILSAEQQAVVDYIHDHRDDDGLKSVAVKALAGTGKTTLILEVIRRTPGIKGVYLAFNKDIADEVGPEIKAASNGQVWSQTFHSMAFYHLRNHMERKHKKRKKGAQIEANKYRTLINELIENDTELAIMFNDAAQPWPDTDAETIARSWASALDNLIHFTRVKLVDWDDEEGMNWMIRDYGLYEPEFTDALLNRMVDMVPTVMHAGEQQLINDYVLDFDDMIYWPVKWDVFFYQKDWIFVDEAQDLNPLQRKLVHKATRWKQARWGDATFIVIVGDPNQSIYRFTGADSDSFDRTCKWFSGKDNDYATTFPLTMTRRCDKIITHHAAQMVPDFVTLPDKERGKVVWWRESRFIKVIETGDMVISRVKAPLIGKALECLTNDIPAIILGSNIGKSLAELLEKITETDDDEPDFDWSKVEAAIQSYRYARVQYWMERDDQPRADTVADDCDALLTLVKQCEPTSISQFENYVDGLFSDDSEDKVVTFCTAHKSKGLQNDRVFLLSPDKMPLNYPGLHPEDVQQEENLHYVAATRAKHVLVYLTNPDFLENRSKPDYVQEDFEDHEWTEDGLMLLSEAPDDYKPVTVDEPDESNDEPVTAPGLLEPLPDYDQNHEFICPKCEQGYERIAAEMINFNCPCQRPYPSLVPIADRPDEELEPVDASSDTGADNDTDAQGIRETDEIPAMTDPKDADNSVILDRLKNASLTEEDATDPEDTSESGTLVPFKEVSVPRSGKAINRLLNMVPGTAISLDDLHYEKTSKPDFSKLDALEPVDERLAIAHQHLVNCLKWLFKVPDNTERNSLHKNALQKAEYYGKEFMDAQSRAKVPHRDLEEIVGDERTKIIMWNHVRDHTYSLFAGENRVTLEHTREQVAAVLLALSKQDGDSLDDTDTVEPKSLRQYIHLSNETPNQGLLDRGLVLARDLQEAGLWDGDSPIYFEDVSEMHRRVKGIDELPITDLSLTQEDGALMVRFQEEKGKGDNAIEAPDEIQYEVVYDGKVVSTFQTVDNTINFLLDEPTLLKGMSVVQWLDETSQSEDAIDWLIANNSTDKIHRNKHKTELKIGMRVETFIGQIGRIIGFGAGAWLVSDEGKVWMSSLNSLTPVDESEKPDIEDESSTDVDTSDDPVTELSPVGESSDSSKKSLPAIPREPTAWAQHMIDHANDVVIVDFETSNVFQKRRNVSVEPLQMSIISMSGDVLFSEYFMPDGDINPDAAEIHGITKDKLESEGAGHWRDRVHTINRILKGKYIIAYNKSFDERVYRETLQHYKTPIVSDGWHCAMKAYLAHNPTYDNGKGYGFGSWWKLTAALEQEGIQPDENAHDALADVQMTRQLIEAMASNSPDKWKRILYLGNEVTYIHHSKTHVYAVDADGDQVSILNKHVHFIDPREPGITQDTDTSDSDEAATKPRKSAHRPGIGALRSNQAAFKQMESVIGRFSNRDEALEFMELLRDIVDNVHPPAKADDSNKKVNMELPL